jgi:serine-type D-Ala-D-Ala carboxypeptidase/endopeptidase
MCTSCRIFSSKKDLIVNALLRFALSGLSGFFIFNAVAHAQTLPQDKLQATLVERIDKYTQGVGIAAFIVDEKGARFATHGSASATKSVPITPDTLFEIGSVTKTFTGLLLAELSLKGVVKLDDPVEKYLPANTRLRDSAGAPIRLMDLATHRSGLPRIPDNFNPPDPANPYAAIDEKELLKTLQDFQTSKGHASSPKRDTKHAYSNLGYGLLGYVLGRADGSSYSASLTKRVLQPLGLTSSFTVVPAAQLTRFADGHNDKLATVLHWDFQNETAAAGALRMSARDLARYAQAALGLVETPLAPAFALAMRVHAQTENKMNPIGLAWLHAPLNGRSVLNHDGGTYGFSSSLWLDPSRKAASAVLANAFVSTTDLALHMIEPSVPMQNFAVTQQKEISVRAEEVAAFVGVYALAPTMDVKIRAEGARLYAQATGQDEFEIFPKAPGVFFAKIAPIELSFSEAKDGKSAEFSLDQNGAKMKAKRK